MRFVLSLALLAAPAALYAVAPKDPAPPLGRPSARVVVEPAGAHLRVQHAAGTALVPRAATRVCALAFQDELLALGLEPVAVATDPQGRPVDYLRDRLRHARAIRTEPGTGMPDLDAVAASRPELILTTAIDRRVVGQLQRIAPTVVLRPAATMFGENGSIDAIAARLLDLADVLDRRAQAERFLRGFHDQLATLRRRVAAPMAGRSIAFLRTRGRAWRLYGHRGGFGGEAVFVALGLAGPDDLRDDGNTALDPERLLDFDADFLIVVADPTPGAAQGLDRLRRNGAWRRIAAVRAGRVHEVHVYRHWVLSGPLGKLRMANDIADCVLR